MANSDHVSVPMEEKALLSPTPGSADAQNNGTCSGRDDVTARHYKHHRRLAICSIICGNSCLGIKALINSVKAEQAEQTNDLNEAAKLSQLAKKYSIISILVWIVILASFFALLALGSYLMTLID